MKIKLHILLLIIICSGCTKEIIPITQTEDPYKYKTINTVFELENILDTLNNKLIQAQRTQDIILLWDSLKANDDIPFVREDTVLFLYKGNASKVQWAGDFNAWNSDASFYTGDLLDSIQIWKLKKTFPKDARLDYKIVLNNNNWILDPVNNFVQYSGFGPNSELRMTDWENDVYTELNELISKGSLSDNILINSTKLGYSVQYKVYTPSTYESVDNLPVIYITDGHEYSHDLLGSMVIVLDNLIHLNKIEPIVAVFVDPRNPLNFNENRRGDQYTGNIDFANFLADELKNEIDGTYKTNPSTSVTAILGTSLGGWNSAFVGFSRSDRFNLIGIHSPAFKEQSIFDLVENSNDLPLKVFMSTGVIFDTETYARQMKTIFDNKAYENIYIEVNQGHSWGNWRALIDEPLIYFYGITD